MRRIIAQARKELTQLLRDRLGLGLALVLPVGLTALLGTSISLTVTDIPIVIQDLDQTPLSRRYADAFGASLTFRVVSLPPATSPETMLGLGRVRAAVIIPEHFMRELRRGRPAEAQVIVDATDSRHCVSPSTMPARILPSRNSCTEMLETYTCRIVFCSPSRDIASAASTVGKMDRPSTRNPGP